MPRLGNEIELYLAEADSGSAGFAMVGCSTDLALSLVNEFFSISDMTPDAFRLLPTFTGATITGSVLFETIAPAGKLTSVQLLEWCNEKVLLEWRIITDGLDLTGECYFEALDIAAGFNQVALDNFTLRVSGKMTIVSGAAVCPLSTGVTAEQSNIDSVLITWAASGASITGFIVRVYNASTGDLVDSSQIAPEQREYDFAGFTNGGYIATVQTLCLDGGFSNETNGVAFTISDAQVWTLESDNATGSTNVAIAYGPIGEYPSNIMYSGPYVPPLTGVDSGLPAINFNIVLQVTGGDVLVSATLNGIAGIIDTGLNTAAWPAFTGNPLAFNFTIA